MRLSTFERLPPAARARIDDGLSVAIDAVATRAPPTHSFLRYGWYAAALDAYGGRARTLVVEEEGRPALALPFVGIGPGFVRGAAVPGSYWPFRSFPLAADAGEAVLRVALATLARAVTLLRIGPVYDDDAAVMPLIAAARAQGWAVLDRFVADSWLLDMAARQQEGAWPRGSTLRKNRFHEKHLADHGALDWRFPGGAEWAATFDAMAAVEQKSWIAARTDGRDAKFTDAGHGAFWRDVARDPVLARMLSAAMLTVDGQPAAFSFDLDCGAIKYAIANSYDPAFAKHSPGKLLYYRNLIRARDAGIATVDWGAGDSGYKQTIGAMQGPVLRDWLLVRPGLPALVGQMLKGWWGASGNPG